MTVAIAHTFASPPLEGDTETDTTHKVLPVWTHWAVAVIFSPLAGASVTFSDFSDHDLHTRCVRKSAGGSYLLQ